MSFHGASAGAHPPTWAQQHTWRQIHAMDAVMANVPLAVEIPPATDLAAVLAAVRTTVERHEALRTRYRPTPAGGVQPAVAGAGELAIPIYEIGDLTELSTRTDELVAKLHAEPFGEDDLPVRAAVVTVAGVPHRLALAISHLSVDGWGSGVVYDELRRAMASPMDAARPAPWQPRDQAAFEQSDRGRRRSERALSHWRDQLQRFPLRVFQDREGAPESPRFRESYFESRAAAAAAYTLAGRTGTSTAAVVLAAWATVLARLSGHPCAFLTLLTPNRIESRAQTAACNLYQHVPISIEVAGAGFDEVAGRALVSTIKGYRHGQCDPAGLDALQQRVRAQRGGEPDPSCLVNLHLQVQSTYGDHRETAVVAREPLPSDPAEIAELTGQSTFIWRDTAQSLPISLYLAVWAIADTAALSLWCDTALFPSPRQLAILTELEQVLVEAVSAPPGRR